MNISLILLGLGALLSPEQAWNTDAEFDGARAEDLGVWEVRYAHKSSEAKSRPRWRVVPRSDDERETHLSVEPTGQAGGTVYIGQRLTLPASPIPPAELAVTYKTYCPLAERSGGLDIAVFSPATWDELSPEVSAAAAIAPDIFRTTVHPNGHDAIEWTEARAMGSQLQRALELHAGEEVVIALAWSTWHPAEEEWAKFDQFWIGDARPLLRPLAWPTWHFADEPLLLRVEAWGAESIELRLQRGDGPEQSIPMTAADELLFEATVPPGTGDDGLKVEAVMTARDGQVLTTGPHQVRTTRRPTHPGVLFDLDDIERMRAKIRAHEWAKSTYLSIERNADKWLARTDEPLVQSGGWYHDYVCPDDGGRLSFREDSPTRHLCRSCGKEWTGPKLDAVWIASMHGGWASGARDMALVYQLTGDGEYGRGAARVLLFYARNYASFPLGKGPAGRGKVMAQSLSECSWLLTMIEAADLAFPEMTVEEQRIVERDLIRAAAEHTWNYKFGIHNIQCWHNAAMSVSGYFLGDPEMIARGREGSIGFEQQIERGVLSDGMWYERSLGYHTYTISALLYHCRAARHAGDDLHLIGRMRQLFTLPLRVSQPNLVPPSLNDQGYQAGPVGTRELVIANAWYGDPEAASALRMLYDRGARKGGLIDLVYLDELPEAEAYRPPGSEDMAGSGLAVLRSGEGEDALCAMLEYGEHGGGHGHPDKLQLILYGLGRTLCPDLGTTGYGVPLHRGWYKTTPSHNTVVIGHANQRPTTGKLLAFTAEDEFSAATAESDRAYPGYRLVRRILIADGIVVDLFEVAGDKESDLDWFLRAPGELTISAPMEPHEEQAPNATYGYLSDLRAGVFDDVWSAAWAIPDAGTLHLTVDAWHGTQIVDALAPSMAGRPKWRTLRIRRRDKATVFRVVHQLLPPGIAPEEVLFSDDRIRVGDRTVLIPATDEDSLRLVR